MTTPDPGVYISPAQMYQEVRGLAAAVGRIETKIDGILNETKDIRTDVADHESRLRTLESMPKPSDLEPRVTALEKGRWPLPTIATLAGVAGAATGAIALFAR
ncbi:hypothetical protein ACIQ6Y_15230 [Streptomyces sp. NPDC096205]|uniref:hypothetical protein n=1 Tax=Streptomyces sp. NPDC096205 TaxID=3366081 RepID=UPI00381CDAAF